MPGSPSLHRTLIASGLALSVATGVAASSALGVGNYPDWTLAPVGAGNTSAQEHVGTLAFGVLGFPATAAFENRKTVRDMQSVALRNSDPIVAGTPWADIFGPSAGDEYLSVRVDYAQGTVATATYVFANPLPPGAWGFTLGDIDVDEAHVSATGAGGATLSGAQIQGGVNAVPFNFLDLASTTLPTWHPDADGGSLVGDNGDETEGDAGWFMPSVPVKTLTVRFNAQVNSGSPSYRTWFAVVSHPVTGTVTEQGTGKPVPRAALTIEDASGNVLGVAITDANGNYSLPDVYAQGGYSVLVRPPAGYTTSGAAHQTVSTAGGPAVANFIVAPGNGGGETGSSSTTSVVAYSDGDAALVVTPGLQTALIGRAKPIKIVTTCTVTTQATIPAGLAIVSTPGASRSGRTVKWVGSVGPFTLTVKPTSGRARIAQVPVRTTCADGSTTSVVSRLRVIRRVSPVVPVTG